jgi:hypothetical protein
MLVTRRLNRVLGLGMRGVLGMRLASRLLSLLLRLRLGGRGGLGAMLPLYQASGTEV